KALGGLHTLQDFAQQTSSYVEPIAVGYGELELYELPPSNQGIVALMLLKMLSRIGRLDRDPVGAQRYHVRIEAARMAYAARDAFLADPDMAQVPVAHLLDDGLIGDLAARVDRRKRRADLGAVVLASGSDTVCISIVDATGMAVS